MAAIGGQMQVGIHQNRLAPVPARCMPVAFQSRPVQQRRHSCVVRAVDGEQGVFGFQSGFICLTTAIVCPAQPLNAVAACGTACHHMLR